MEGFLSETERFEHGVVPHDLPAYTPELIALQALIDLLKGVEDAE